MKIKGFTLIELVITMTITVIIASIVVIVVVNPIKGYFVQSARAKVVADAQMTIQLLANEFEKALVNSIIIENNGKQIKYFSESKDYRIFCDQTTNSIYKKTEENKVLICKGINNCNFNIVNFQDVQFVTMEIGFKDDYNDEKFNIFRQVKVGFNG